MESVTPDMVEPVGEDMRSARVADERATLSLHWLFLPGGKKDEEHQLPNNQVYVNQLGLTRHHNSALWY
ncbi:hypothetical protein E2C01_022142 [Portunus trituberculatus]|uniref:Uncharacterized protein n=1 Tax=Portunus trituberculatus TaxID=210409 RepID=A0A5B7E6G5_PORTR|nr:hypothetical protein [Portunus trituberculatus]